MEKVINVFESNPSKWIVCTHRDLVKLGNDLKLETNQVVEAYYKHFMK